MGGASASGGGGEGAGGFEDGRVRAGGSANRSAGFTARGEGLRVSARRRVRVKTCLKMFAARLF